MQECRHNSPPGGAQGMSLISEVFVPDKGASHQHSVRAVVKWYHRDRASLWPEEKGRGVVGKEEEDGGERRL